MFSDFNKEIWKKKKVLGLLSYWATQAELAQLVTVSWNLFVQPLADSSHRVWATARPQWEWARRLRCRQGGRKALGNFNTDQWTRSTQRATGDGMDCGVTEKAASGRGNVNWACEDGALAKRTRRLELHVPTRKDVDGRPGTMVWSMLGVTCIPVPISISPWQSHPLPQWLFADAAAIYSFQPSLLLNPRLAFPTPRASL